VCQFEEFSKLEFVPLLALLIAHVKSAIRFLFLHHLFIKFRVVL
jgi:hypothetical protein